MTTVTGFIETLVDNFDENALNMNIWTAPQGTSNITNTSNQLHISPSTGYPYIVTSEKFDLTQDILAIKWLPGSGTATASLTLIVSADDSASTPNQIYVSSTPVNNGWTIGASGAATVSGTVNGTGLGTSLASGTWYGIGNMGATSVVNLYTSTDGVTWTLLGSATVGGTFGKTAVKMRIQLGYYTATESPTWVSNIDTAAAFNKISRTKVRVGGAWVESHAKVRVGGAWVTAKPKPRVGGVWVPQY